MGQECTSTYLIDTTGTKFPSLYKRLQFLRKPNYCQVSGQSYKQFTLLIYESRVVNYDRRVFIRLTTESYLSNTTAMVSSCDTVGRAVTSDTRDPQFESSYWPFLFTVNCIEKTKIKKEDAGNRTFLNLLSLEAIK